jgi:hypothetical protein
MQRIANMIIFINQITGQIRGSDCHEPEHTLPHLSACDSIMIWPEMAWPVPGLLERSNVGRRIRLTRE